MTARGPSLPSAGVLRRRALNHPGFPIYVILLITWCVAWTVAPSFRAPNNLQNLLIQTVAFALAGLAQTFVILAGDVDLSVGGIISIVECALPLIMRNNTGSILLSCALLLAFGTVLGLLSGFLVTRIRVEPMVLTLAINFSLLGFALFLMPFPDYSKVIPKAFIQAVTGKVGPIQTAVFATVAIAAVSWYVIYRTRFGLHLRAIGADKETAFRAGIKADRIRIITHGITGFLAAVTGLFLAGRMGTGDPTAGANFSLDSMTAAVAGGTLFSTGVGSVVGTIGGAFLIVILGNVFNHLGVSTFFQYVLRGLLLVFAVAAGAVKKKYQESRGS